jgi:hypothetical protein
MRNWLKLFTICTFQLLFTNLDGLLKILNILFTFVDKPPRPIQTLVGKNWLYDFFPKTKLQNAKIFDRHFSEFRTKVILPKRHLFEWAKVQHVISSNSMFSKRQIVEHLKFCKVTVENLAFCNLVFEKKT